MLFRSKFISSKNVRLSNNASYSRVVPVAKNAVSYAGAKKAIEDARKGIGMSKAFSSVEELMEDLNADD